MSRAFDGVDDQMVYTIPSSSYDVTGAHTILIVARIMQTNDAVWLSFIEHETSAAGASATLGRRNNGNLYWANGTTASNAVAATDSDNWCVFASRKPAGVSGVTTSKCVIGGANTHTNDGGAHANAPGVLSGTLRIGGNDDFANIRVAAAAVFPGTQLADADLNGIASAKTTQSIADLSPTWLVDDSDAFATNLVNPGVMDRASITGTADDADDPSGWVYGLGGAAATSLPPLQSFRVRSPLYSR